MNKKDIKKIISESKQPTSYEEKLQFLKGKFEGNTCYVLGCGPSLRDIDKNRLLKEVENTALFTIKQSYFSFKDYVDFHFFNTNNYSNYPNNNNAFFIGSSDFDSEDIARAMFWKYQQVDICTSVIGRKPLGKKQYDENFEGLEPYTFKNSGLKRHWGAGIMFENVLFFAMHLGFSEIRTVGWDYSDPNSKEPALHFYSEEFRLKTVNPCNPAYAGEMLDSINLAEKCSTWFKSQNINLTAYESDNCFLPNNIERFKI